MSKLKKIVITLSLCFVLVISFFASYFLSLESINKENKAAKDLKNKVTVIGNSSISTNGPKEDIITKNTKIIFQNEYKKSGEIIDEKTDIDLTSIIGKTKKELEEIYGIKGYIIKEMDSNHVDFLKTLDRYSPEKYVIDIFKDANCIAIFKTDFQGKESIEDPDNDIKFETKISDVKEGDLDTILQGRKSLQFDTKQDAIENYKVLFTF